MSVRQSSQPITEAVDIDPMRSPAIGMITIREVLTVVFMNIRLIAAMFLIPVGICILLMLFMEPKYEAKAALLVRLGRETLYQPEISDGTSVPIPIPFEREQQIKSETEILLSRDNVKRVIRDIGLNVVYPNASKPGLLGRLPGFGGSAKQPEQASEDEAVMRAVVRVKQDIDATVIKDTSVVEVSFLHHDKKMAALVVNRLVEAYLDKRKELYSDPRGDFAREQVAKFKARLQEQEQKLLEFKREHKIISIEQQRHALLQMRDQNTAQMRSVEVVLAENKAKLASYRETQGQIRGDTLVFSENIRNDAADEARRSVIDLRLKLKALKENYVDHHPMVAQAEESLREAEAMVASYAAMDTRMRRTGRTPVRDAVETNILNAEAAIRSAEDMRQELSRQIADLDRSLNDLENYQSTLDTLERDRAMTVDAYQEYMKKQEKALIQEELDDSRLRNVRILQPATLPLEPKRSRKTILLIGLVLGMVSAMVTAFVIELTRSTFSTQDKLSRTLGISVLVTIPLESPAAPPAWWRRIGGSAMRRLRRRFCKT